MEEKAEEGTLPGTDSHDYAQSSENSSDVVVVLEETSAVDLKESSGRRSSSISDGRVSPRGKRDDYVLVLYEMARQPKKLRRKFKHPVDTPEFFAELSETFTSRRKYLPKVKHGPSSQVTELYPEGEEDKLLSTTAFTSEPGALALSIERSEEMLASYFMEKVVAQMAAIQGAKTTNEQQMINLLETRKRLVESLKLCFGSDGPNDHDIALQDKIDLMWERLRHGDLKWKPDTAPKESRDDNDEKEEDEDLRLQVPPPDVYTEPTADVIIKENNSDTASGRRNKRILAIRNRRRGSDRSAEDEVLTFFGMIRKIPKLGLSRAWRRWALPNVYARRVIERDVEMDVDRSPTRRARPPSIRSSASEESREPRRRQLFTMQQIEEDTIVMGRLPRRLLAAILSAAWLLVPMLIMVINPSYLKTLVTGSVSIALFALSLVWFPLEDKEVIGAVGAYAAVQVVFIALVVPAQSA